MKVLLFISTLILIVSCGKYKKPFITFKSPEKRLMDHTWRCVKAVDSIGNEFVVYDHITFMIDGNDSVFVRNIDMDYFAIETAYLSAVGGPGLSIDSTEGISTITGSWNWGYALNGKKNKQIIELNSLCHNPRNMRVHSLSNKHLVIQDETRDNVTYYYNKL
jgi:hypothetical protein